MDLDHGGGLSNNGRGLLQHGNSRGNVGVNNSSHEQNGSGGGLGVENWDTA